MSTTPSAVIRTLLYVTLLVVVSSGCASAGSKTVIIDTPTPPGEIAPQDSHPDSQRPPEPYRPQPAAIEVSPQAVAPDAATVKDFLAGYRKAGSPRMLVYVNRELSADVREWASNERLKVGYVETSTANEGGKKSTTDTVGTAVAAREFRGDTGEGRARTDQWTWRLEDAITQPLIQNGVNVVDRAMVLRMTAAETAQTPLGDEPTKLIETNALKKNADLLVEVLISSRPDDRFGYVFRLQATNVKTRTILASCSSATWPLNRRVPGQYVATNHGYQPTGLPDPETVGAWLASDLMAALALRLK